MNRPLQYESGSDRAKRDPQPPLVVKVLLFMVASGIAAASTFYITGMAFLAFDYGSDSHLGRKVTAIVSAALLAGVVMLTVAVVRRPSIHTAGKWSLLGLLFGSGLALLIDGICFTIH